MDKKSTSERRFLENHHEFWRTDDGEVDENENAKESESNQDETKEFMQLVEQYTAYEDKLWDCYQLFCKLVNHKYNPYEDKDIEDLEDYLFLQEAEQEEQMMMMMQATKNAQGMQNSIWPFKS